MKTIKENGWDKYPVCMAKTQYSFTDDPKELGAPVDFDITIRELSPRTGAGIYRSINRGHHDNARFTKETKEH